MSEAHPPGAVDVELEVPFHDVDALRVVWHGHYAKYAELGRTALMRSRNLDVDELTRLGYPMVVIETQCRYIFPLRYGERLRVRSWLSDIEHRLCIGYEIHNLTQARCSAKGRTVLATLAPEGHLFLATPDELLARLR